MKILKFNGFNYSKEKHFSPSLFMHYKLHISGKYFKMSKKCEKFCRQKLKGYWKIIDMSAIMNTDSSPNNAICRKHFKLHIYNLHLPLLQVLRHNNLFKMSNDSRRINQLETGAISRHSKDYVSYVSVNNKYTSLRRKQGFDKGLSSHAINAPSFLTSISLA